MVNPSPHRKTRLPSSRGYACTSLATAAIVLTVAAGSTAKARGGEPARDELDKIFTSDAEVQRLCAALSGSTRSMTSSGTSTPYSDTALQAVRAAHIDDALLLLRHILGDSQTSSLVDDVAEFIETGVPPASLVAAAKAAEDKIESQLKRTQNGKRLLSALEQSGIDTKDLLEILRRGPDAIDTSALVVRMALRLAQGAHERVDHFASGLPWGLGGVVGWLTEMVLGELMAVGVVAAVKRIEARSPFVRSAEIAHRACGLIEQDATRPVLASRMLRQLVVRLSKETPTSSSIATYCGEHPRKCARLSRRWGIRTSDEKIATRKDFVDASFFEVGLTTKYIGTDEASLRARLAANAKDFEQSLEICSGASTCSFEQINYALSIIIFDRINRHVPEVPPGDAPRECIECCETVEDEIVPPVCRALSPGSATDVALVVDRSGSTLRQVASGRGYEVIARAASTIATELEADGARLSTWAFPQGHRCDAPDAADIDIEVLRRNLEARPIRSYTPLRATLERILAEQRRSSRPLSLVIVTDGGFNCAAGSRFPWKSDYRGVAAVVDQLGKQGVAIHGVLVDSDTANSGIRRRAAAALAGAGSISSATSSADVARRITAAGRAARCNVALAGARAVRAVEQGAEGHSAEWSQIGERIQLEGELCDAFLSGEVVRACV